MGLEYIIANRKTKQLYQLGKGSWFLLDGNEELLTDDELLCDFICNEINNFDKCPDYVTKMSKDLVEFAKNTNIDNILIFNDSGDDLVVCKAIGYIFVGSRYESDSLDELNSHLTDNKKHMYLEEDYINYREYERYKYPKLDIYEKYSLAIDVIKSLPKCYKCNSIATKRSSSDDYDRWSENNFINVEYTCDNCGGSCTGHEISYSEKLRGFLSKVKLH